MLTGIDASSWNTAAQLDAVRPEQFAIIKATESVGWSDPQHAAFADKLRKEGVLLGHYHFGYPNVSGASQAAYFLAVAKPRPGEVVVLDWEYSTAGTMTQRVTTALEWLRAVKKATGASPWFYSYPDYINGMRAAATTAQWAELTTYPLWIAAYNGTPGVPGDLHGWPIWTAHQYADGPTLDRDVFNGDANTWKVLGVPAPTSPRTPPPVVTPPPAPKPPTPPTPAPAVVSVVVPGLTAPVTLTLEPKK